ncbi:MAG TPA: hypothetical protein VL986_15330, partial [Terracidiphilus sp.]|nr:hypothetical protein [Terracidiphilus sp.]
LVTRIVFSKSAIRRAQLRPKPVAFNPSPYNELSVIHTSKLTDEAIWEVAKQTRGTEPGRTGIYCRVDAPVQSFNDFQLRALRDDKPFKRHTSIVDWPLGSDGNEAKALWKHICLGLSEDPRITVAFPTGPVTNP